MKTKIITACVMILIAGLIVGGIRSCIDLRGENARLTKNQRSLLNDVTYYRTQDSLSAASVEQLSLTAAEFRRHYEDLTDEAKALSIKVKRLEAAARTATVTTVQFETVIRDSIVYRAGRIDTIRCMNYADPYLTFSACEDAGGKVTPFIQVRDTLIQFVHRVPKRFLFFRYGTRAIRQEVVSRNPNTEIVYTEYIKLK